MHYLVMDLEMSGVDPVVHDIIQIGACLYTDKWVLLGTYSQNIYPENIEEFNALSEKIHGLSLEDLEDEPLIYDVLPEFENWVYKTAHLNKKFHNLRDVVICGQSVINDINYLQFAYRKAQTEWPFSFKLIDLHTLAYFYFQILTANKMAVPNKLSLNAIAGFFGIQRAEDAHNALEDAQITADCFKVIFQNCGKLKFSDTL